MPMAIAAGLCVLCCLVVLGHTLPVDPRADRRDGRPPDSKKFPSKYPNVGDILDDAGKLRRPPMPDTPGLDPEEYNRYWKEMAKDNPGLQERLKKLNPEQLAELHPRVSERMARDSDGIRNRLEEARRMNIDEMRELQRLQMMQDEQRRFAPDSEWVARQQAMRENLPENFNKLDIEKRLEDKRRVLEEIERKRREDFEQYQMQQEHQRREKLKTMNEQQRLMAEQTVREQKHHERMNQPASKKQLEEVWQEDDGLKDEEFDPRTFFFLHDTNGDKILDQMELQALFYNEVKKAYGNNLDNMQIQEELARMREFALKQLDRNGDTMISLQEFMSYTEEEKFEENDEWKAVADEEEAFTEEELNKFDDYYDDYYDYEYDDQGNIVGFKDKPSHLPPAAQPPAPEGARELMGDPETNRNTPAPVANEGEEGAQHVLLGGDEGALGQHHDTGMPGEQQPQGQDEGVPGEQQLHIQPAGTQREGQAQQFHKNQEP